MPTYRNDGSVRKPVKGLDGNVQQVEPGDSIQTYHIQSDADLTETAATPYYNSTKVKNSLTSTGSGDDQTVTLDADTEYFAVWKVTGGPVNVYFAAMANTPAIITLRPGDSFARKVDGKIAVLMLEFDAAGTCEVLESIEPINLAQGGI